jgi:hypothetical protein
MYNDLKASFYIFHKKEYTKKKEQYPMSPKIFRRSGALTKAICLLIVQAFLFSNIALAVPTSTTTDDNLKLAKQKEVIFDPEKIIIPREAGLIKSRFAGKNGKLIVHIQDAHCNFEAQSNIAKIIETLAKNYNLSFVAVEGADGIVDTSWFKAFPDEDVRKEVATYFMKKGEITGPEFLSITTNYPLKLFGAETRSYYIENLNAFTSSYPLKEETEKYYNNIKSALNKLKGYIYNAELKTLDQKMADYESKKLQFNDYVRLLQDLAEKHKINLREYDNFFKLVNTLVYEKKINFEVVDKERSVLIDELSKSMPKDSLKDLVERSLLFKANKISSAEYYEYVKGVSEKNGIELAKRFPDLSNYIIYNSVYSKIENENLFKDIKKLEIAIKDKLFQNEDQRTLEALSRHIDILVGLVNIKLLNDDFEYYKTHKEEFSHEYFADFIKKKAVQFGLAYEVDPPSDAVANAIPKLEDFYRIAIKRDNALVDNTLKEMATDKQEIGVLVTGGFHSEGIARLLEGQGISYAVVCPSITKDVPTPYIQILTNQRTSFEDILVSAADAKKGLLAPAVIAWMAGLSPKDIETLKALMVNGDDLEKRLIDVKKAWMDLDVGLWLGKALDTAATHNLARDINVMKEAYALAMKNGIAVSSQDGQLAESGKALIRQITTSKDFNDAFEGAYKNQSQLLMSRLRTPTTPAVPGTPMPSSVQTSPSSAPARPSTFSSLRTMDAARAITQAQAYSSVDAFNQYVAGQITELIKAVQNIEVLMKQYRAMPDTTKAEKDARKAFATTIDTLIIRNFNSKIAAGAVGANFNAISSQDVVAIPILKDFVATPTSKAYIAQAEALLISPDRGMVDVWAGAASRLFGEVQEVDPKLSYAAHDVYKTAKMMGQKTEDLVARGAMVGISMATRLMIQERINLEERLERSYEAKGIQKTVQEISFEAKKIISKTPRAVVINDESGPSIIKEWVDNNFFGHNPELVPFVVQPTRFGFTVENNAPRLVTTTKPTPAGHGDATMQVVLEGRAFIVDTTGKIIPVEGNAIAYLMAKTSGRIKLFTESRVNDMLKLDTTLSDNSNAPMKDVDVGLLALKLFLMEDTADLTQGKNIIFEQVGQDMKNPIKGASPVSANRKDFLIEALAQDEHLAKIVNIKGVPFNRFFVDFKPTVLTEVVKSQGFPIYLRFRDGYIYPETVTGDATMLDGANAGYVVEKTRQIADYKDAVMTLETGIKAALKQDASSLFREYALNLRNAKLDVALTGLENAPDLIKMPKTNDAVTITGRPLTEVEYKDINAAIKEAFETTDNTKKAIKISNIDADARGMELYVIPGLAPFDSFLLAHPGRGGEAVDVPQMRVYVSPVRWAWSTGLPADARQQFWAHELEHLNSKSRGEFLTEEDIQKRAPIDKVLAAVKGEMPETVTTADERLELIKEKYNITSDIKELVDTLTVLRVSKGITAARKVVLAYDTGLDPKSNTATVAKAVEDVLNEYLGKNAVIVVRGTGKDLLDRVRTAVDPIEKSGEKVFVVTLASDTTLNTSVISQNEQKELGKIINVKNKGDKHIQVAGLFDLALRVAYELGDESILRCLNRIAVNPNNTMGFTKDDLDELLKKGVISILPRIQRIDTSEAVEAYNAASQVLKSL